MRGARRASPAQQSTPVPAMYHLSQHAFACETRRYYVFLDLLGDKYISVPREDMAELVPWIHGGPFTRGKEIPAPTHLPAAAAALAAELVALGVLAESPPERKASMPIPATPVTDLPSIRASLQPPERSLHLFLGIAASLMYARRALRSTRISLIVGTFAERKRAMPAAGPAEWDRAAQLTAVFLDCRPLFPWDYRCLLDSLALIRFLSRFDVYPDWIFGVQDDPFNAHCWVQAGTRVLNDDLEHVRTYTIIMTV